MRARAVTAGLLALVLTACTGSGAPESDRAPASPIASGSGTSETTEATPTPAEEQDVQPDEEPSAQARSLPPTPPLRRPAVVARHLDQVATTLRDPDSTDAEVRAAGEYQQLAARSLAFAPRARRVVLERVRARTARTLRNDLEAAEQLTSLAGPQPRLPRWRIVEPPPPRVLLRHYRAAERRTGAPWYHLAAIHLVETRMGRIRGTSTAGAQGPMQFIPPTWERYGAGGDVTDYRDAIVAAGRLLRDYGAPRDMENALWHYNPSDRYVRAVSAYARNIAREPRLYRGYWHWRVLYRHERGTYVLPHGYPRTRAVLLAGS